MSANEGKRFIDLLQKREMLKGAKVFGMLLSLATSQYAVKRNYHELSTALDKYEGNLDIWAVEKRALLNAFLKEFSRLLHNYLSSIYSLIQHTQQFRKELGHSELNKDYYEKLKDLQSNNCVKFVRDLRTYSQHIGLLIISANLSFTRTDREAGEGKIEHKILLEKKDLMKWKKWHRNSRRYINSHEKIDLKIALGEYQTLIKDFYQWFYKRVMELYSKELKELAEIDSELARLSH
jgi:hypothetical protein